MSKNIEYTWSVDHKKQKGDSKMNADRYVFTKGSQAKEQAGTILDKLILKFLADQPTETYQKGFDRILALNPDLSRAYGRSPQELI